MNYNEIFRQRTKAFDLSIIKQLMQVKYDDALKIMSKLIIRPLTSVDASYSAFGRARYNAKMSLVVREADETAFWLKMLHEAGYLNNKLATKFLSRSRRNGESNWLQ
ncbi:four helix bundle protein [bacterium]|nr:four helix bundle protein [bacterium]